MREKNSLKTLDKLGREKYKSKYGNYFSKSAAV
jgi:hypothetical protein